MSHIAPISMKAGATITANKIVKVSAANTVTVPAAATDRPIGITADYADTDGGVPVNIGGISKLQMNDTLAAGALVASNNAGQGVPHVDTTAGSYVIGVALEACAATGTVINVLIQPHFKSIP